MRIGLDIDDTICDTYDFVLPYICKYYNLDYKTIKKRNLGYAYFKQNCEGFFDFAKKIYKVIIPKSPLKRGVIKYINKLKKDGHEIILITGRDNTEFDNPYQITYDYLISNNVPFDTLITGVNEKGPVCLDEKIDIFIDDLAKNCVDVSAVGIKSYLFNHPNNKGYKGIKRIRNFRHLYKIIKKEGKNGRR